MNSASGRKIRSLRRVDPTKDASSLYILVNSLICCLFQVDLYYELSWLPDFDNVFDIESYV
jgi:hypothetical protein